MKKNKWIINNIITLFCFIFVSQICLSQSVQNFYVNMPDALNPSLNRQSRLELLEYHKAGQGDSILNRFGKNAYLQLLDTINQIITVKNAENSTFEMKVFPLDNGDSVIGIIETVCAPICQSMINFYDTTWSPVKLEFIMPKAVNWLNDESFKDKNVDRNWALSVLETSFVSLSFDTSQNVIIAKNNSLEFVNETDRKLISSLLYDKILKYGLIKRQWILQP